MRSTCQAVGKSGPCQASPLKDDAYCWFHSESNAEERVLARSRGGRGGARRALSVSEVLGYG